MGEGNQMGGAINRYQEAETPEKPGNEGYGTSLQTRITEKNKEPCRNTTLKAGIIM